VSPTRYHASLAAIALIASTTLLVGGYLAFAAKGGWFADTPPMELQLADATVITGQSTLRGSLWAPTADAQGVLIIRLSERTIDTDSYPTLRIAALADTPPLAARFLWRQADGARTTFAKTLAWQGDGLERIALARDPAWRGRTSGLALALKLEPHAGLLFQSATLLSDTGESVLTQIAGEWFDREPWGEHSVNYLYSGTPNSRVPMLPAAFAIAAAAFGLYFVLARRKGLAPSFAIGVAFAIGAWIAVDARWQLNLFSNLRATAERYAGKTTDEKHRVAEDSKIYLVAEAVRRGLPAGVTKVTLVSDLADSELFVGKLRYYLFPLWLEVKSDPLDPRAVLAIVQSERSALDSVSATLTLADGRSMRVETLVDDPMIRLVRIR
jgi:hypothetical protein